MKALYRDTPLAKAVFDLLTEISDIAEEKHGSLPSGSIRAFIFGGCAVHIYTNARGSSDLDAELEASKSLNIQELIVELGITDYDDDGEPKSLYFDKSFNPAIPDLHPDWREEAIPLQVGDEVIHIYLVKAVDIAVSKLGRCTSDDVKDILSMYGAGRFTVDEFKARANEALDYSPTPDRLRGNIDYAIQELSNN